MNIPVKNREKKIVDRQRTADIMRLLLECEYESRMYNSVLKKQFCHSDPMKTTQAIFDYMKKNIVYIKESEKKQTGKTIGRIISDGFGDCKAFATFAICALKACGINANFRLASYKKFDKTPTHIYAVATIHGKKVVVDGTLSRLDLEAPYQYAYDVKPI